MQVLTHAQQLAIAAAETYPGEWTTSGEYYAAHRRADGWTLNSAAHGWNASLYVSGRGSIVTATAPGLPTPEAADAAIAAVSVWSRGL